MSTSGRGKTETVPVALLRGSPGGHEDADRVAKVFKALADPVRVRLVSLIRRESGGEACFCDLAAEFDMPQPSLSHHLRVMVTAGVLSRERRGTWSWYRIQPEALQVLEDWLCASGTIVSAGARRD